VIANSMAELPEKYCHNKRERGHRREYKTNYLQKWRKSNAELNESYWRQRLQDKRVEVNATAYRHFRKNHAAILIQMRLRNHGFKVSLKEAKRLLRKFGRCYPMRSGLTRAGLRECERIRSRQRIHGQTYSAVEIRMMVYEAGNEEYDELEGRQENKWVVPPVDQPHPHRQRGERLRRWHESRRPMAKN